METIPACKSMLQVSWNIAVYHIETFPGILARTKGKDIDLYNLELYSQKPKHFINEEAVSSAKKYKKALDVLLALKASGYKAIYGWRKGDGFWVYYNGHTVSIQNGASGNPYFFLTHEALLLAEQFPNN